LISLVPRLDEIPAILPHWLYAEMETSVMFKSKLRLFGQNFVEFISNRLWYECTGCNGVPPHFFGLVA